MATIFKSTGHAQFDKLLEKATSNLLLEPEWASIIQICDLIRQKDCQPKYAITQIRKKLLHPNPHVSFYALQVLESIVKNCGSPIHEEIATKQFMEELRDLAKTSHHDNIREKILELIQTWAHAFRKIPSYRPVQDVLNIMKTEGAKFPPLIEADAMFVADQAPEWADGECCHRCRVEFGVLQRKHHCRACGQIFCSKCSSKECTLPRFGIEKEVRVCDACFEKYGRESTSAASSASGTSSSLDDHVVSSVVPTSAARATVNGGKIAGGVGTAAVGSGEPNKPTQKELELAEEEQLQLALAISQSEAEAKEQELKKKRTYNNTKVETTRTTSPPPTPSSVPTTAEDPELSRYLNRAYWENKSNSTTAPAPTSQQNNSSFTPSAPLKLPTTAYQQDVNPPSSLITNNVTYKPPTEEDQSIDNFVDTLRSQIEMFVNRMKSNSSRGRPIANDTSVQSLFMSITHMHSQLLAFIQTQDNARGTFELLQDKLNQVRDARAALDDLRSEHAEEIRRQQEEQERIRAYQMAQKLALMRQKKNEYLQYQRQLAMQRMQEQEREMQMRIAAGQIPGGMAKGIQGGQAQVWGQQGGGQGQQAYAPPPSHMHQGGQGGQVQGMYGHAPWMSPGGSVPPPQQQIIGSPVGSQPMMYDANGMQMGDPNMMMQQPGMQGGPQGPQQMQGPPPQQQMQGPPPQQQMQGPPPQQQMQGPPPQQQMQGLPPQQQMQGPPPQQQMQGPPPQQQMQGPPPQQQMQGPPPQQQMQGPPPQQQMQGPQQIQQDQVPPPSPAVAELISFD